VPFLDNFGIDSPFPERHSRISERQPTTPVTFRLPLKQHRQIEEILAKRLDPGVKTLSDVCRDAVWTWLNNWYEQELVYDTPEAQLWRSTVAAEVAESYLYEDLEHKRMIDTFRDALDRATVNHDDDAKDRLITAVEVTARRIPKIANELLRLIGQ
jgi:hypothetical protein